MSEGPPAVNDAGSEQPRARGEERLRSIDGNFEHLVDNIPGLVFTLSPDGELEFLDRRVREYFGRTLAELGLV